jgi:hypothetical protein
LACYKYCDGQLSECLTIASLAENQAKQARGKFLF